MSATEICHLCGLKIGVQVWTVRHEGREMRFCCEGCKGIYQMLNNLEDDPAGDGTSDRGDQS